MARSSRSCRAPSQLFAEIAKQMKAQAWAPTLNKQQNTVMQRELYHPPASTQCHAVEIIMNFVPWTNLVQNHLNLGLRTEATSPFAATGGSLGKLALAPRCCPWPPTCVSPVGNGSAGATLKLEAHSKDSKGMRHSALAH